MITFFVSVKELKIIVTIHCKIKIYIKITLECNIDYKKLRKKDKIGICKFCFIKVLKSKRCLINEN